MPHLPFHPAMGMAAMMPGTWALPQNPISAGVRYQPTLGEMMPAFFSVPQNPLLERYTCGLSGCRGGSRCGCAGCGGRCDVGMGSAKPFPIPGMSSFDQWWEGVKDGEIVPVAIGAVVVVGTLWMLGSVFGGKRR